MHFRSLMLTTALVAALQGGAAAVTHAETGALQAVRATDAEFGSPRATYPLRRAIKLKGIRFHQRVFQLLADRYDDTRASATRGYDLSARYVQQALEDLGDEYFDVKVLEFDFPFFEELSEPSLVKVESEPQVYTPNEDFFTMTFSAAGDVRGRAIRPAVFGCDEADFDGDDYTGAVAVISRGECTFALKATNAEAAGAAAVVVFNDEARAEPFNGTLGGLGVGIPVVGTSYAIGLQLLDEFGEAPPIVSLVTDTFVENRTTSNVVAETRTGNPDQVIMLGAHLDSVDEGPGVQDNGSGSGGILEIALQMAALDIQPTNKVRFAWWGAEESGLLGSIDYVNSLSDEALNQIALNLNFDMIGSPNYVFFIYDGDGSAELGGGAGPAGSDLIEQVFLDYWDVQGEDNLPTAFDGRSDYFAFIASGIPAGGLFTGAEGIKSEEEAEIWGGRAGRQYDPCYHEACDTFTNISLKALVFNTRAAAHAMLTFAMAEEPIPPSDGPQPLRQRARFGIEADHGFDYQGNTFAR